MTMRARLDHVILTIGRLDDGIEEFARVTGVRPARGGRHPGRGTENALAGLGERCYLEILAPAGEAPSHAAAIPHRALIPRPCQTLTPNGWALQVPDLAALAAMLKAAGFDPAPPAAGSRRREDGAVLRWRTMGVSGAGLDLAPFFIEWGEDTPHPGRSSPAGCRLERLELTEPDPAPLQRLLDACGFTATVGRGERRLQATLTCPNGRVTFGG